MRYYPVSRWSNIEEIQAVKFAYTFDTEEKAKQHGLYNQNAYKDSIFLGVVSGLDYVDCTIKAEIFIKTFLKKGNKS